MKPEAPQPQFNPENLANQYRPSAEIMPVISPELNNGIGSEQSSKRAEVDTSTGNTGLTVPLPMPVIPTPVVDNTSASSGYPLIANDDDLIEKEWVDRAKKILAETKDDPYKREKEVSKLQIDYIKKRYGRELGVAE